VKKRDKKVRTRIYTNGDLASEALLKQLADSGLDEIRFGLKPDESGIVEEAVLKNLENAVKYIPYTMVEMPPLLGKLTEMEQLFDRLEAIGVKSVNILEFLFPWVHRDEYLAKGYKINRRPYRVLYDYGYAGGIPVAGSALECLKLVKYAAVKGFKMGVHYCSLENKLTAQIWHQNTMFTKKPLEYFSKNDFFVKSAKAYGDDAARVAQILEDAKRIHYIYNKSDKIIEFPITDVPLLKGENMQLGISYMVFEYTVEGALLREVAVYMADTENFNMEEI
jgi:pyruvate formate-lyase activating enzyme-like uncharacterized protein